MKNTTNEETFNKWMFAALTTWTVLVLALGALIFFAGDRIWFNLTSHDDVSALMQDKAQYMDAYSFADVGNE